MCHFVIYTFLLITRLTLWGKFSHYLPCIEEETKPELNKLTYPRSTASKRQSTGLCNSECLTPESNFLTTVLCTACISQDTRLRFRNPLSLCATTSLELFSMCELGGHQTSVTELKLQCQECCVQWSGAHGRVISWGHGDDEFIHLKEGWIMWIWNLESDCWELARYSWDLFSSLGFSVK